MKKVIGLSLMVGSLLFLGCTPKNYYNTNADGSKKHDSCEDIRNKIFAIETSDYPSQYSYKEVELLRVGERRCNIRDKRANKDHSAIESMHNEVDSLHNRADALIQEGKRIHLGR
ncbi:MAG TPA: hypothetical protein ENK66_08980 [Arcobacter sp.]|nr:hypothetical protein [Arcobacter sp.]